MCIGVKLALIYVDVVCGVGFGQPLHALALEKGGRVMP